MHFITLSSRRYIGAAMRLVAEHVLYNEGTLYTIIFVKLLIRFRCHSMIVSDGIRTNVHMRMRRNEPIHRWYYTVGYHEYMKSCVHQALQDMRSAYTTTLRTCDIRNQRNVARRLRQERGKKPGTSLSVQTKKQSEQGVYESSRTNVL